MTGGAQTVRASTTSFLMVGAFLCVFALVSYRAITHLNVPGHPNATDWVQQDFRDSVYYPVVAFLHGKNPYDASLYVRTYPVWRPLPLYSPLNVVIHLPFGLLPYQGAELAYYLSSLVLTLLLARWCLRLCGLSVRASYVCGVAALILLSRPGQMNLLLGQVSLQCVLGAYVALYYAQTRPWLAGMGLALTTFKPTFGLPLAVLMLCRRDARAVAIGLVMAGGITGAATAVLVHAAGGTRSFAASLLESHRGFARQPFNDPASAPFRIDTPALVERFVGADFGNTGAFMIGLGVLSLGALTTRRAADCGADTDARQLSTTIICLTVLTCAYHQAYDLLLLAWPFTALAADRWVPQSTQRPVWYWFLLAVLLVPAVNYLASATALDSLGLARGWRLAITAANGGALLAALLVYSVVNFRRAVS